MKNLLKLISLICAGILLIGLSVHAEISSAVGIKLGSMPLTLDTIRQVLPSANNAAFGKDNLLVVRISKAEEDSWNDMLKFIEKFVTENQTSLKLTTPLVEYLKPVSDASAAIFLALNNAYYNCIRPGIKDESKKNTGLNFLESEVVSFSQQVNGSLISPTCLDTKINGLKTVRATVLTSFEKLKSKIVVLSSENAREAIYMVNFNIRQVIDKIFRDLEKIKAKL